MGRTLQVVFERILLNVCSPIFEIISFFEVGVIVQFSLNSGVIPIKMLVSIAMLILVRYDY